MPATLVAAQIAEICHEANRIYCQHAGGFTSVKWHKLTNVEQQGQVDAIEHVFKNPDITPKQIHQRWVDYKTSTGWTPGGVIDRLAKVHPNIAPWDSLPVRERIKDEIFLGIIRACRLPLREITAPVEAEAEPA